MEVSRFLSNKIRLGTMQRQGLHYAGKNPGPGQYNPDDKVRD